jgi:hypothetical protein
LEANLALKVESFKFSGYSQENKENSLSDHAFYHFHDNSIYKISCCLISPSVINQYLNKKIYNFELQDYNQQQNLIFSKIQRENLEFWLKQSEALRSAVLSLILNSK